MDVEQTSFVINQVETKAVICTCVALKTFQKSEKNASHVLRWLNFHVWNVGTSNESCFVSADTEDIFEFPHIR